MAVIDASDAELHVATAAAGPYNCIGKVLTYGVRDEAGGAADKVKVLCQTEPIASGTASEDARTIDVTTLRDQADTLGQGIVRAARRSGAVIYVRALHDGTTGEQQPMTVDSYSTDVDPNGTGANQYVRDGFTLSAAGPVTDVSA